MHVLEQFTFRPNDKEMPLGQLILLHSQNDEAKSDDIEKGEHQNLPLCRDVSIQTENQCYSDSKDNCSDANCIKKSKTDTPQNDCNDKHEEYSMFHKISINISYRHQNIKKIDPISDKNAWIISGNQLHKITNHILDDKIYAENVCDIVMLRNECVFIILTKNTKIVQLVNENRLVLFANSGNQPFFPYCACATADDSIIVLLLSTVQEDQGVIGYAPENDFECYGICSDTKGNILVSDFRHHSGFILDKNLKYKRRLVNASDGLYNPKSVGLIKGSLWIADENGILILKNEHNVNNSMCLIV
ncbi:unnamed protein product [Mytilus coruscus]|uniref:Uncharacterized protein n=1 Tax=Mytilus coruscus TaxID=42192 RepID=A0A6J8EZR3_MYTCO|nr:unnamed protein product [Mytilus coruscus]